MRVDYQISSNSSSYAHYTEFSVGNATEKYLLTVGGHTGGACNHFDLVNNQYFSTRGNDNDGRDRTLCSLLQI